MCANCSDAEQPYDTTRPDWVAKAQRRLEERLAGAPPTPAEQAAADSLRARWGEARFEGSMLHAEMTVGMGMAGFDVPTDSWILDIQEKLYRGEMTHDEARRLLIEKHELGDSDA